MAATYHHSLLHILAWNLYGQWMHFVFGKGYSPYWEGILLPRFGSYPPPWWREVHYYTGWWTNNLTNGKPNAAFKGYYRGAARYHLEGWIADKARGIATPLVNVVSDLLGTLYHGYTTFSTWINAIRGRVGTYVPNWADHLAHAAVRLFDWFPSDITAGVVSFYDKFLAWYEATKSWVRTSYDAAKTWVANVAPGLVNRVEIIRAWFDAVGTWVTNFKNNPYGTVAGWLGTAWFIWRMIYSDILNFHNHVWVPFKITLHDFLADPLGWMYDRVEDELIRRW